MTIPIAMPKEEPVELSPSNPSGKPENDEIKKGKRLLSLDAYRGFVMLAMASGGFGLARVWDNHRETLLSTGHSESLWESMAYQFSHVPWVGCSFWDLIQPSFMFMVGVSMPFSYAARAKKGQSAGGRFLHALIRSIVLIVLGVFLSSNWSSMTNFTFVNVLTQIGLGYIFVYLLVGRSSGIQGLAALAVLGGYWYVHYDYQVPSADKQAIESYVRESMKDSEEQIALMNKYEGLAGHWNKHTNWAAEIDRDLLNRFPRVEDQYSGQSFWVNRGGYQTLNFIPSIATMIFGLMAGQLLMGPLPDKKKCRLLFAAGFVCLLAGLAADTHIWPVSSGEWGWTICPTVKRIWTPTWAVFSTGWALLLMGTFYLVFDILNVRPLAFPMVVVGMNSIAFYVMAQLIKPWIRDTWETHFRTIDAQFGTTLGERFYSEANVFTAVNQSLLVLATLWLIAFWMYRRKIFIRV